MMPAVSQTHPQFAEKIMPLDPLWSRVRVEAEEMMRREPALATLVFSALLSHQTLEDAVMSRIAALLDHADMPASLIRQAAQQALKADATLSHAMRCDIHAVLERDPATKRAIEPILYYKGFQAIQSHRLAHWLYKNGRQDFALYLQSRNSAVFQIDIHPQAPFGKGIFFDHATGIVIGQTAVLDDDVSILQGVTLGGTGKETGDRHPKIGKGVLIGAGAKILGNFKIGAGARVAAGSVVLMEVPPCKTVAGVPAKIVGDAGCAEPARTMNQNISDCCG
jgi:serine O-acetyltransferase